MHLHGFFAAASASVEHNELRLTEAGFSRVVVTELPTTVAVQVIIVFSAEVGEDLGGLQIGFGRPDGSQTLNLTGFIGVSPELRWIHAPVSLDLYEEGPHTLLLYPGGEEAAAVAEYPFDVVLMPT